MNLIVGLGNPGKSYENTPHNTGFEIVEELAGRWGCALRRSLRFGARLGRASAHGRELLLAMPLTYMNNSGLAVSAILRYHRIEPADLIVALDDADLELGRIRIRPSGSSAGHKGLLSVVQQVGTEAFSRVRVGIGRRENLGELADHVLSPFSPEERRTMDRVVARAADAVESIVESGVDAAMNRYNAGRQGGDEHQQ